MSGRAVEFWCHLPVELEEIFRRFTTEFRASKFVHDAENVWEWFDGLSDDGRIGFNITRQWEEDQIPDEPARISLLLHDDLLSVDEVGQRLAKVFEVSVHTGKVNYVSGDEFEWSIVKTYVNP